MPRSAASSSPRQQRLGRPLAPASAGRPQASLAPRACARRSPPWAPLAARGQPVGHRQQRDVDLHRRAGAQVAVHGATARGAGARGRESRVAGDCAPARRRCARSRSLARNLPSTVAGQLGAARVVADEGHAPVLADAPPGQGLGASCNSAPQRSASPRVISSASGSASSAATSASVLLPPTRDRPGSACSSIVRSSTSSVWPYTSRWWKRFCSIPRSASQLGQHDRRRTQLAHQLDPASRPRRGEDPAQLDEHPLGRHAPAARPPARARPGWSAPRAPAPARPPSAPGAARAEGRRQRRPVPAMRRRRAVRSSSPPSGSIGAPPSIGSAIAFTVKSRSSRSARSEPPRNRSTSACHAPTARHHPPRAEVLRQREARRPPRRAGQRARRLLGVAVHHEIEIDQRPAQHAIAHRAPHQPSGLPASAARATSSPRSYRLAVAVVQTWHARRQRAGHLVVDRLPGARPPPRR